MQQPGVQRQGLFILLEGLTGGGGFRAKRDKKGKKGQETLKAFLPLFALLALSCFPSAFQAQAPNQE
jgi:hypothetical protein